MLVAAVGNDGPFAPPLYPAPYAGVVGVTGVSLEQHVSALFLSLSAHAGLLGAGSVAVDVTGSVVGGMNGRLGMGTPMSAMNTATLNAASNNAAHLNAAAIPANRDSSHRAKPRAGCILCTHRKCPRCCCGPNRCRNGGSTHWS